MKKLFTMLFAASMTFAMTSEAEANKSDSSEEQGIVAVSRSLAAQLRQNHLAQFRVLKASLEELVEGWRLRIGSFDEEAATEVTESQADDVVESTVVKEVVPREAIDRLRQSVRDSSGERVLPARRTGSALDRIERSSTESAVRLGRLTHVEQLNAADIADSMLESRAQRLREAARNSRSARSTNQGTRFSRDVPVQCDQLASSIPGLRLSDGQALRLRSADNAACQLQAQEAANIQARQDWRNGAASR